MKLKEIIRRIGGLLTGKAESGAAVDSTAGLATLVAHRSTAKRKAREARRAESASAADVNFNIIRKFYRLGPEGLTWLYNVDVDTVKKHIVSPDGIIGPNFYKQYPGALENMEKYDNDWFVSSAPKEVLERFRADLLCLAEKHKQYGAYSVLASVSNHTARFGEYMRLAALHGNREGMVGYGIHLARSGETKKAGQWVVRGADLGEEIGMLCAGITYQYGTLTPIDLDKAAHYYRRLINEYRNFYAYINLGTMYVEANYFHTAYGLFLEAASNMPKEDGDDFDADRLALNADICADLLELPFAERPRHATMQYKQREMDNIFCYGGKVPALAEAPTIKDSGAWVPDESAPEIDPEDVEEHRAYEAATEAVAVKAASANSYEDYVFPTLRVKLNVGNIFKSQYELVFIERQVHSGLNSFIQKDLHAIRAELRKRGFFFVYLPAHSNSLNEMNDILHYTDADSPDPDGCINNFKLWANGDSRSEANYWPTLFGGNAMPSDCAGFLRYIPSSQAEEADNYEFIFFPHAVDTDFIRAFKAFFQYVERLQVTTTKIEKLLPFDVYINIDAAGEITLRDGNHEVIAEVKMPVLSKVLYFTFLNHPEGLAIKSLSDRREELLAWYTHLSNRKNTEASIDTLIDPTCNSANEKISRIRRGFETALAGYDDTLDPFVPIGKKGENYTVEFDRSRVVWHPSLIHLITPK